MANEKAEERRRSDIAEGAVAGIVSCVKRAEADDNERDRDLIDYLFALDYSKLFGVSDELGKRAVAEEMIHQGFDGDTEEFVTALAKYHDKEEFGQHISATASSILQCFLSTALQRMIKKLEGDQHRGTATIEAAVEVLYLINGDDAGRANRLVRLCGKKLDAIEVDSFGEDHPYSYTPEECLNNKVRDLLAAGLIERFGPWLVWVLARKFLLGRECSNESELEAEVERQRRIVELRAKIEMLVEIPIVLKAKSTEKLIEMQTEAGAELREIDPDAGRWLAGILPDDRLGNTT